MRHVVKILFGVCIFLSCKIKNSKTDIFFENLSNLLSISQQSEVKNCKNIDSLLIFAHSKAPKEFLNKITYLPHDINTLLLDSFKIKNLKDRELALLIAYQKKLKNDRISFVNIKNEISEYKRAKEYDYITHTENEISNQSELAKNNYFKYKVGDTISLLYPLMKSGDTKEVYFNNFYYKKDYYDTLFLKCVLLKKMNIKYTMLPYDQSFFFLRILKAKNKELNLVNKQYVEGNVIKLPLYIYGREI